MVPGWFRRGLTALAIVAVGTGCATQGNLVDLERDVEALKLRAGQAPAVAAPVNAGAAAAAGVDGSELLDLTIALDQMRTEVAEIRGLVDELSYAVTSLTRSSDARLAVLEEQAGVSPVAVPPLLPESPPEPLPAAPTNAAVPPSAADETVVVPGVVIAPRASDVGGGISADTAYNLALSDFRRGHYQLSATGFANFLEQHAESRLIPDAMFWLGGSYQQQKMSARAAQVWELLVKSFPRHPLVPDSLLKLGETYLSMDDIPAAEDALKRLLARFPVGETAEQAKLMLAELR